MPRYREWDLNCKVYVGNLGSSASKYEIENAFSKYGPLRNVWVARNPPGFAFVEFNDRRDAEDAARGLDGTRCCGTRIRVEMSSGRSRRDNRRRGGTSSGGRGGGGESSSGGRGGGSRYRIKTTFASTTSTRTTSTSTTTNSSSYYFYNKPINNFNNNDYKSYYCYNYRNSFIRTVIPFIKITYTINKFNTKQYTQNSNNYTTLKLLKNIKRHNNTAFISLIIKPRKLLFIIYLVFFIIKFYLKIQYCYKLFSSTLTYLQELFSIDENVVVVVVVCKQYHQNLNYHQNQYHHHSQHNQKHLYNCSRFLQRYCCISSKTSTSTLTILLSPSSATSNASPTSVAIKSTTKTSTKNIKTITKTATSVTTTTTININWSPYKSSIKFINTTTSITFTTTTTSTVRIFFKWLEPLRVLQVLLQFNAVNYWSHTAAAFGFLACLSLLNNISTTQLAAVFFQQQQLQQTPITIYSLKYHHFHQYFKKNATSLEIQSSYFNNG